MEETKESISKEPQSELPLMRNNFIIMAVAGVLIVLGFVLMAGSGSDITAFNPEIFSTRRIVVGPMLSFLGFVLMAVAIVVRPRDKK